MDINTKLDATLILTNMKGRVVDLTDHLAVHQGAYSFESCTKTKLFFRFDLV